MSSKIEAFFWLLIFLWLSCSANGLLSSKGVNFEVQALMGMKASLVDPHGVLDNWDGDAVDPCSWTMITCSAESLVIGLGTPSQRLSGNLSPSIGNLTNLQIVLFQNNNITGPIPAEMGRLWKLHTLDLSDNILNGEIPSSLGDLKSLQYMRLNNNSLVGEIPESLANLTQLTLVDLSCNNLSAPVPKISSKAFNCSTLRMAQASQTCCGHWCNHRMHHFASVWIWAISMVEAKRHLRHGAEQESEQKESPGEGGKLFADEL